MSLQKLEQGKLETQVNSIKDMFYGKPLYMYVCTCAGSNCKQDIIVFLKELQTIQKPTNLNLTNLQSLHRSQGSQLSSFFFHMYTYIHNFFFFVPSFFHLSHTTFEIQQQ